MGLEIRHGSAEDIPRLLPLWEALEEHHAALPALPPVRSLDDSWAHRRAQYEKWLAGDDHVLLVAERDGEPVGYAMVATSMETGATWELGDSGAEVETLSVLEGERGSGVGKALMDEVARVASEAGAQSVSVAVAHSNVDGLRFYEREGYGPFYSWLLKRLP